jgi:hypothetical protein
VSAPTFIAAISSRQNTAAETVRSVERTVRELSSCSELTFTTNWLKLIWYPDSIVRVMAATSDREASMVSPFFSRPMMATGLMVPAA